MSNAISSLIFCARNVDKTKHGDIGRAPVALAQGLKVVDCVAEHNKAVAVGTEKAASVFAEAAQHSKFADRLLKATKWAKNNVNPMICISSGIKVIKSDDKLSTGLVELGAISSMLAGEGIAKKLLAKIFTSGSIYSKIASGVLFVGASIASYSLGEKVGKDLAKEVRANIGDKKQSKIDQMA